LESEAFETISFAELISTGALEIGDGYRAKNDELGGEGLIFLRAGHVTDTHIDFAGVDRFHVALEARLQSKLARPGDAVITTKGNSTGRTALVSPSMPPFVYSPHLSYWRSQDPARLDTRFLHYWSKSSEFIEQLSGMKASTDMAPYLSLVDQRRLSITLPPIEDQRAIAHILGTLDDKIELNRRMNETLEAMARALFQSWFVDFDPVRAKAEGRDPDLPKPLADLFPSRLVDSELGEIPEGWPVRTIADLADIVGGSTPKTGEAVYWEGGTHCWATPKDLSALDVPVLLDTERRITDAGLDQISSGLLPVGTVLLSSRAPIGYLAIAEVPVAVNQGFIAMKPRSGVPSVFLLHWAKSANEAILSRANGSTFLEISKSNFRPIETVAPPAPILAEFGAAATAWYDRVVANARESRTLAELRDTLLPKLISGELRVPQAEKLAAEVV
jgi:type I restriction enzyme S subunit